MNKNKTRVTFTIDPDLFNEFIKLSNELGISRSKIVSIYIKNWISENNSINNLKDDAK